MQNLKTHKNKLNTICEHTCPNCSCQVSVFADFLMFGVFGTSIIWEIVLIGGQKFKNNKYQSKQKQQQQENNMQSKKYNVLTQTEQENKQKYKSKWTSWNKNKQNKNKKQEPETEMRNRMTPFRTNQKTLELHGKLWFS